MPETLNLELTYEGSVKRVWKNLDEKQKRDDSLWFEFTDDYSVFDWGKMPDTIANKGKALAIMGAYMFDKLSDDDFWKSLKQSPHLAKFDRFWLDDRWKHPLFSGVCGAESFGMPHHFQGLVSQSGKKLTYDEAVVQPKVFFQVLRAAVMRPQFHRVLDQSLYFYPAPQAVTRRLIPLEIVFRFGMPSGSSLKERLRKNPQYAGTLGLPRADWKDNEWFPHPVIEFYTKLEPKDRLLSYQEAALMSGLSAVEFEYMTEMALETALALHAIFGDRGIELWDGKIEMLMAEGSHETGDGTGVLLIGDSIGPDELRLVYKGVHLSKEMIRQVYRGSEWEVSISEAQNIARQQKRVDWKEVCRVDLKQSPAPLEPAAKAAIDKLYGVIANSLIGRSVFADHPHLDEFIETLPAAMQPAEGVKT